MGLGFGIIGCGMISKFHAKAIAEVPNAQLVGCFDMVPEAAERLAAETGCKAYRDLRSLLKNPDVQVVTIGTPSGAHLEPAVAAARAGKHVIVEKPLEITLKRCDKIIEECGKAGVVLSTIFPSRFHESARLIKGAIEGGRFGRLTIGDAYVKWYRTQQYYDSGAWRGTWKFDGGGALMNQAIHSVDLLAWLMGPVAEISSFTAMLAHERIEVEDVAMATLRFANGALGVIEATTAAYPGAETRRNPRLPGIRRAAGRGSHDLGLRPGHARRRGAVGTYARQDPDRRRRGRSRRDWPPRAHRPVLRCGGRPLSRAVSR